VFTDGRWSLLWNRLRGPYLFPSPFSPLFIPYCAVLSSSHCRQFAPLNISGRPLVIERVRTFNCTQLLITDNEWWVLRSTRHNIGHFRGGKKRLFIRRSNMTRERPAERCYCLIVRICIPYYHTTRSTPLILTAACDCRWGRPIRSRSHNSVEVDPDSAPFLLWEDAAKTTEIFHFSR